jgi:hypothetical protein
MLIRIETLPTNGVTILEYVKDVDYSTPTETVTTKKNLNVCYIL